MIWKSVCTTNIIWVLILEWFMPAESSCRHLIFSELKNSAEAAKCANTAYSNGKSLRKRLQDHWLVSQDIIFVPWHFGCFHAPPQFQTPAGKKRCPSWIEFRSAALSAAEIINYWRTSWSVLASQELERISCYHFSVGLKIEKQDETSWLLQYSKRWGQA